MTSDSKKLVVVTGLSGSGKSIALDALEDSGFYCIDNLPVSLFHTFADEVMAESSPLYRRAAVGIDARNQANDLNQVLPRIERLRSRRITCEIIFLDAQQDVLIQRFSETRRRHPLTADQRSLEQAIDLEHKLLEPLLNAADLRIDTTRTTLHELRALIRQRVAEHPEGELSIVLESFGFKHGLPRNADFVFDARCLPNPHWRPDLRPFTGKDRPVADFLGADAHVNRMFDHIAAFLDTWIPCFRTEGRAYLTVAVGCTGGQHRSVYLAERLGRFLQEHGHSTLTRHRELP
ncbi:MAG: RNase adapter RapZ [Gammaproteobacteria bacterium]